MAARWITVTEAAERLTCCYLTVINRVARRKLRGRRFGPGKRLAIDARDVERFLREQAAGLSR